MTEIIQVIVNWDMNEHRTLDIEHWIYWTDLQPKTVSWMHEYIGRYEQQKEQE